MLSHYMWLLRLYLLACIGLARRLIMIGLSHLEKMTVHCLLVVPFPFSLLPSISYLGASTSHPSFALHVKTVTFRHRPPYRPLTIKTHPHRALSFDQAQAMRRSDPFPWKRGQRPRPSAYLPRDSLPTFPQIPPYPQFPQLGQRTMPVATTNDAAGGIQSQTAAAEAERACELIIGHAAVATTSPTTTSVLGFAVAETQGARMPSQSNILDTAQESLESDFDIEVNPTHSQSRRTHLC